MCAGCGSCAAREEEEEEEEEADAAEVPLTAELPEKVRAASVVGAAGETAASLKGHGRGDDDRGGCMPDGMPDGMLDGMLDGMAGDVAAPGDVAAAAALVAVTRSAGSLAET